ncbi:hypothetical protein [Spiroplasma endosymbiont of Diplazon laetatorius]|uniref:hypothetical protein n=1 Tax=Spiroplasma endosymbiont of Diplazon laetatorius TaxID=3066322 RepID=UPI0030D0F5B5
MFKLLNLLGVFGIGASSATLIPNQILENSNYKNQTIYHQNGPYGVQEEGIETSLIESLLVTVEDFLEKNNQELDNIVSAKLQLTSTAESTDTTQLKYLLQELIVNGGEVISESYKTVDLGNGNYRVEFILTYKDSKGQIKTYNINTYPNLFNEYQLSNGAWRITLVFVVNEKDINNTENQFISNIELPNYGFKYYSHQVKDMFNNYEPFNTLAIKLIESQKKVKLSDLEAVSISKAIIKDNEFTMGEKYLDNEVIEDEYFYVSFNSSKISGTYNMLIKNIYLK